ncbi:MAG: iron-containing alcohol dehydrogenase [Candidatus Bathyarchaeota archaeon]|nr:iron-containing alcohol dehydrogenase [Candidatus Bathyarchaeota archaeon]
MSGRDTAWYENDLLKDMYIKAGSNAFRGYHSPIVSPKTTFVGTNSLNDFINHISAYLSDDERRVLIVVDKDLRKLGERVANRLTKRNIDNRFYDNVLPDAPKHTVLDAVKICEEYDPKVILAVGGGSAMDTAKLILLFYEQPKININNMSAPYYAGLRKKVKILAAIPTTSGTGAETTFIAVVTDTDRDPPKKTEVVLYEFCPDFVVLHPDFVKTMPPALTMGTGMDALAHSMGSYMLTMSTLFTDMHNLKAVELILKYLPRSVKRGNDMEAREKMQIAAYIAGIGFGNISGGVEHSLGHSFGALFHIHHGICVGLFLCASIAFQAKVTNRFFDLAELFGINTDNRERDEILKDLLTSLRNFMKEVNCPLSIRELKSPEISKEEYLAQLDQMVEFAFNDYCTLSSTRRINRPQYRKILEITYENKMEDLLNLFYS